jgi:hypothetical protein
VGESLAHAVPEADGGYRDRISGTSTARANPDPPRVLWLQDEPGGQALGAYSVPGSPSFTVHLRGKVADDRLPLIEHRLRTILTTLTRGRSVRDLARVDDPVCRDRLAADVRFVLAELAVDAYRPAAA